MSVRSRACLSCKNRKVKCDEQRPSCRRCLSRNVVCQGYPKESDLIWRNENPGMAAFSEKHSPDMRLSNEQRGFRTLLSSQDDARLSRRPSKAVLTPGTVAERNALRRPKPAPQIEMMVEEPSSHRDLPVQVGLERIMPWLKQPIETSLLPEVIDQAVALFFSHHVLAKNAYIHTLLGYFEELPSMYQEAPPSSALAKAVKAISLAGLLTRFEFSGREDVRRAAQSQYLEAVAQLRLQVGTPERAADDATLMAILVLDQMEVYHQSEHTMPLGIHFQGVCQILQLRGTAQMFSARGWALFRIAHHRLVCRCLLTSSEPPEESYAWMSYTNQELPNVRNALDVLDVAREVSITQKLFYEIEAGDVADISTLLQPCLTRISKLEQRMTEWPLTVPREWKPTAHEVPIPLVGDLAWFTGPRIYTFEDLWVSFQWNWHYAAHIRLLESLIRVLLHLQYTQPTEEFATRIEYAKKTIVSFGEEVLAATPQLLGLVDVTGQIVQHTSDNLNIKQIGSYFIIFALQVMRVCPYTTAEQTMTASNLIQQVRSESLLMRG